jgi:uroporphyrinogen decarboxylase
MIPRKRLLTSLHFQEPDRIPIDLASTQVTGISIKAYQNLCKFLDVKSEELQICDTIQQICIPNDDIMQKFGVDTRGLFPLTSHNDFVDEENGEYLSHVDEWGLSYRFKKRESLWYDLYQSPFAGSELSKQLVENYNWPRGDRADRFEGLKVTAKKYRESGYAVVLKSICAGLLEMAIRLRGMEDCLMDLLINKKNAGYLLDKILQVKLEYWEAVLNELGDLVDVVAEGDDFGTQTSQLISFETYKEIIRPRQKELISTIKKLAPNAKIFFHSCGNIREFLPDFIDMGIDIINPVHITAAGMEPVQLKKDFGQDVIFWGGGIDTQGTLPNGTPDHVREQVKRNINALAPGGGFVFNTIHNIQADVPPENIVAMYETVVDYGKY